MLAGGGGLSHLFGVCVRLRKGSGCSEERELRPWTRRKALLRCMAGAMGNWRVIETLTQCKGKAVRRLRDSNHLSDGGLWRRGGS